MMNKFNPLDLLRLVTLLPLIIVLFAMAGDGQFDAVLQPDQIASQKQQDQHLYKREG